MGREWLWMGSVSGWGVVVDWKWLWTGSGCGLSKWWRGVLVRTVSERLDGKKKKKDRLLLPCIYILSG